MTTETQTQNFERSRSPAPHRAAKPKTLASLQFRYASVRAMTDKLCLPLAIEDCVVQPMADVSPPKWHLAHTTWFFEEFVLKKYFEHYRVFHERYDFLFNSYYESVGARVDRDKRGQLSRPTVDEIRAYRAYVDHFMGELLNSETPRAEADRQDLTDAVILGLHHEQQHQELLVTDIKNILWTNPLRPAYAPARAPRPGARDTGGPSKPDWVFVKGGLKDIGDESGGFAFDNEKPRHKVYIGDFELASRPVTNGEFLEFIEDGGYRRPHFWLSEGWACVQKNNWQAPLYWETDSNRWSLMTMAGMQPLAHDEPVCHISFFEADAFARWKSCRLPTEFEWEAAASNHALNGHFVESGEMHPRAARAVGSPAHDSELFQQLWGDVWEWTGSSYLPYPGFKPLGGQFAEYNGKFMNGQMVLRGGSCATPASHIRLTFRNFFSPSARWQFSGVRLAR